MEPQNTGSFGATSPDGMEAIKQALARREGGGGGTPALDTQSMGSPTSSPQPAVAPESMPTPQTASMGQPAIPNIPQGNPESRLIVSALKERLKAISIIEGGVPQKGMM